MKFKLDTGSEANILPKFIFETLPVRTKILTYSREKLSAYNYDHLNTIGCCKLACKYKGKSDMLLFHMVDTNSSRTGTAAMSRHGIDYYFSKDLILAQYKT